jgi:phage tail-like protein
MASSASNKFPLPKFHFKVKLGDAGEVAFQEVTGLTIENEFNEYRNGSDLGFVPARRASIRKSGTVTFKKGLFKGDDTLIKLYKDIVDIKSFFSSDTKVINIEVSLYDETGSAPAFVWKIQNAIPTKLSMESLNATENAIAIEQIDFTHSGIEIKAT